MKIKYIHARQFSLKNIQNKLNPSPAECDISIFQKRVDPDQLASDEAS